MFAPQIVKKQITLQLAPEMRLSRMLQDYFLYVKFSFPIQNTHGAQFWAYRRISDMLFSTQKSTLIKSMPKKPKNPHLAFSKALLNARQLSHNNSLINYKRL